MILETIPDRPISLEVLADDMKTMGVQARKIASWGNNVNVKIPVTNTKGEMTTPLIRELSSEGIVLNITAILTLRQVEKVVEALCPNVAAIISVFAGNSRTRGWTRCRL